MPATLGAAIIAAANWTIATVGGIVAPGAFITPFATSGTLLGVTSAQIVGTVALTGLSVALTPSLPSPASQKITVRDPVGPRRRFYGYGRIGGKLFELKVAEPTGDGILYVGTILMSGRISALDKHWVSGQEVRIDGSGQVLFPAIWLDTLRVQLYYKLGTATQTVYSQLTSAFPGRWTSVHRLDGLATTLLKNNGVPLEDFATVYQAGIPNYSGEGHWACVWDPRLDNNYGGSGTHDLADETTWEWSDNPALIILDYLKHDDGMRLPFELIEPGLDEWVTAANYCDELVDLIGGGTEKRYTLFGGYEFTEAPKEVLRRMLTPIDGRLRLRADGAIVLDIGKFEEPSSSETLGTESIIGFDVKRGAPKTELKNEIRATYTSAGHNFQPQEADPWRDEDSIALDGTQTGSLDLSWCTSHRQARVRMKVEANRKNPEWQGTIITNANGLRLMGKRYARFILPFLDATFFIVNSNIDLLSGSCMFEVVSFPSTAYDWEVTEEGASPEFETPGDWGYVVPTDATSLTITADGAGGGGENGGNGGGGGARSVKTIAIDPADWGTVILFTVGAGGLTDTEGGGASTSGGASTVTGTLTAGTIAISAGGGQSGFAGGGGGTASGGDTNTSGGSNSGGNGGTAASGAVDNGQNKAETPGGGGHEWGDGGDGRVVFDWTF